MFQNTLPFSQYIQFKTVCQVILRYREIIHYLPFKGENLLRFCLKRRGFSEEKYDIWIICIYICLS